MQSLTQSRCNEIARILNNRPRKRHGFRTPLEKLNEALASHYNVHVSVAV